MQRARAKWSVSEIGGILNVHSGSRDLWQEMGPGEINYIVSTIRSVGGRSSFSRADAESGNRMVDSFCIGRKVELIFPAASFRRISGWEGKISGKFLQASGGKPQKAALVQRVRAFLPKSLSNDTEFEKICRY